MGRRIQDVVVCSFIFVIIIIGTWKMTWEVVNSIFPLGLVFALTLVSSVHMLRIPAPSKEQVEAILGKEPHEATDDDYCMKTVAHRGAGLDAPENSLAAFRMCKEKNCDAIEFDVSLTLDEIPVIFHDDTLERMVDVQRAIRDLTYDELQAYDLSVKHPFRDRFMQTNIPTLDQAVTQLLAADQRMFIDIKENNYKFVKIIHDVFKKYPALYSKAVVSSFFPGLIYSIRRGDPKIVCSMAWRPHAFTYISFNYAQGPGPRRYRNWYKHYTSQLVDILHEWLLSKFTYYMLGLSAILLHKDVISGRDVLEWRQKGVRVMAWTANSPAEKQYFSKVLKITYLTDTLTGEGTTHLASS